MYDSVDYRAIPAGSELVAGYVDGRNSRWPDEAWDAFPGRILVRIAVLASTNDGHMLDVETGDATPDEVPGWLAMRRAAGVDPTVYGNADSIRDVTAVCIAQGVSLPHFMVANYDRDPTIPDGYVAKQYWEDKAQNIDYSSVADYWPGVDAAPSTSEQSSPVQEDDMGNLSRLDAGRRIALFEAWAKHDVTDDTIVAESDAPPSPQYRRFIVDIPAAAVTDVAG
jgi:hypothetical protein